ncbi:expressed unknown protein [Seminavis robusta]|uniref:Uncharacterized protein n=1 Tax=Seminavis robusta TaxID=568900 RepID=A0A9N8E623_9STRA|nr:expressed unknown protein [Seminavis robusta]|eukprot:Sro659_g182850.1 n/a (224) ;mRNA; f:6700-7371
MASSYKIQLEFLSLNNSSDSNDNDDEQKRTLYSSSKLGGSGSAAPRRIRTDVPEDMTMAQLVIQIKGQYGDDTMNNAVVALEVKNFNAPNTRLAYESHQLVRDVIRKGDTVVCQVSSSAPHQEVEVEPPQAATPSRRQRNNKRKLATIDIHKGMDAMDIDDDDDDDEESDIEELTKEQFDKWGNENNAPNNSNNNNPKQQQRKRQRKTTRTVPANQEILELSD